MRDFVYMWDEVQGPYDLLPKLVTVYGTLSVFMGSRGIKVMDAGWWPWGSPISLFVVRSGMGMCAVTAQPPFRV